MSTVLLPDLLASLLAEASAIEVDTGSTPLPGPESAAGLDLGERLLSVSRIEVSLPAYFRPAPGAAVARLTFPSRNKVFERPALIGRVTLTLVPARG